MPLADLSTHKQSGLWSSPLVPVVVTILCLLPFIHKAFHIDDPLFLWTAQQIQKHPLDFYGFSVNWYGWEAPMVRVTQNPPLASYYIAMIASLTGYHEIPLHIAFMIPAIAVAVGTFYLGRRFSISGPLSALTTVLTPVFLVSGTTLMCDMLMLAFWVWAIYLWMEGIDNQSIICLLVSSLFASLAFLTKYFGGSLIALLVLYVLVKKTPFRHWGGFLLIPIGTILLYQRLTVFLYGKDIFGSAFSYVQHVAETYPQMMHRPFVCVVFIGGCFLPLVFYRLSCSPIRTLLYGIIAFILVFFIFCFVSIINMENIQDDKSRWVHRILISIMLVTSGRLFIIIWKNCQKYRSADTLVLLFWILGTVIFSAFINWSVNARSLLPMAPAIGIIIAGQISNSTASKGFRALDVILPMILSVIISLAVAWGDYVQADTARTASELIHKQYAGLKTVWFEGHWGFQYYMQLKGYMPLNSDKPQMHSGDILVAPQGNTNVLKPGDYELTYKGMLQIKSRLYPYICLMNKKTGCGFYSHFWGSVPYTVASQSADIYFIVEINSPKEQ